MVLRSVERLSRAFAAVVERVRLVLLQLYIDVLISSLGKFWRDWEVAVVYEHRINSNVWTVFGKRALLLLKRPLQLSLFLLTLLGEKLVFDVVVELLHPV